MALTRFTLGFQVRLERLWEWLTLMPKAISLPQNSHFAIYVAPPFRLISVDSLNIIALRVQKSKRNLLSRALHKKNIAKSGLCGYNIYNTPVAAVSYLIYTALAPKEAV